MKETHRAYMLEQLKKLLAIDSTTGFYKPMENYLAEEIMRLGYQPHRLVKGGVSVDLGGKGNGLVMTAHADDIGFMVRYVNPDGTIRVCNVGGLHPFMVDEAGVRLYTRDGRVYMGNLRKMNPSLHLMQANERGETLDYEKNLFLFLDEEVHSAEDVAKLGIRCGDVLALEPNTVFTPSGYIKSRFLDDKVSVAVLLTYMKYLKEEGVALSRHVTVYFSLYEEVGHGGSCGMPNDTTDVLAVDIGCCGPTHSSDEKKVSIGTMDTAFPYHRGLVDDLIAAADAVNAQYALDIFIPYYGSDANAALRAGLDVRHGLIGPGVLSTHGYERTHIKSLEETYALICSFAR